MRGREEVDVMLGTTKKLRRLALLLGGVGMLGITVLPAHADQPPPELKMILAPGQGSSDVITFSADEGGQAATKEVLPETSRTAAPVSSKATTTSSPKTAGQAAAAATPMTVLPAEATAESAEQRAELVSGKARIRHESYEPSVSLGVGYRWDSVNWNIAGSYGTPNILSELTFDEMESLVLEGGFHWRSESNLYLRGAVDIGTTIDGDAQDSDYLGNDRTLEFSRSYSDADGGSVFDISMGIGYLFEVPLQQKDMVLKVAPLVGYSYHKQDIEITNGWQIAYSGYGVVFGPLIGLDSSYEAEWTGPWIGLDIELELNRQQSLRASIEYHWVDYEADANWNLRTAFAHPVSFEHESDGDGFVASLVYTQQFASQWFWTVGAKYSNFEADPGKDITYFANGNWDSNRLNEVEWESYAIMVGIGFRF